MTEGERLKQEGIEKVSGNPSAAPWRAVATMTLRDLARSGRVFTSEDVTRVAGQPPTPNSVGAIMNAASRQGWIERVGFDKAERANQHAALISSWRGIPEKIPNREGVSPIRSPGRYVPPAGDPGCPIHGSTCRKVWHREDPPKPDCSCGEGPVGHSTTHTSTDKPGVVRISREGKTDQYMNIAATRAASAQAQVLQSREDEIARQKATPRVDPRSHRLTFGGPVLCRRCGGTGGTLWEGCYGCGGTGLTS